MTLSRCPQASHQRLPHASFSFGGTNTCGTIAPGNVMTFNSPRREPLGYASVSCSPQSRVVCAVPLGFASAPEVAAVLLCCVCWRSRRHRSAFYTSRKSLTHPPHAATYRVASAAEQRQAIAPPSAVPACAHTPHQTHTTALSNTSFAPLKKRVGTGSTHWIWPSEPRGNR